MAQSDLQAAAKHETVMDVGAQQAGTLYAKALLGAATDAGNVQQVLEELDAIVTEVLDAFPSLGQLFSSAMVGHDEMVGTIDRVFAGKVSPLVLNFLKVLSAHGRLSNLRDVQRIAREMYDEQQGRVRVKVETAHPLDGAATTQITGQLRTMLAAEPVLDVHVNPALIGGIVLRVGDKVYDGSVATQLKQLRQKIIDRSVHEIQSGRDRFSHSEGN